MILAERERDDNFNAIFSENGIDFGNNQTDSEIIANGWVNDLSDEQAEILLLLFKHQ